MKVPGKLAIALLVLVGGLILGARQSISGGLPAVGDICLESVPTEPWVFSDGYELGDNFNEPPVGVDIACWTLTGTISITRNVGLLFTDPGETPGDSVDPTTLTVLGTMSFDDLDTVVPTTPADGIAQTLTESGEIVWIPTDPSEPEIYVIEYQLCDDEVANPLCSTANLTLVFNDPPFVSGPGGILASGGTFEMFYALIIGDPGTDQNQIAPGFDQTSLAVADNAGGPFGESAITGLGGECRVNENGNVEYTAPAVVSATDSCFIQLCELRPSEADGDPGQRACGAGEVSFEITDLFMAVDDMVSAQQDTPIEYSVATFTANDISADPATFSLLSGSTIRGGTVVVIGDALIYTPPSDFFGNDFFTYQICSLDNGTICDTATVTIQVEMSGVG